MKYSLISNIILKVVVFVFFTSIICSIDASNVRLKELVDIKGARGNQLFGYGLVVGLKGTGDKTQTVFTGQSLTNMLDKMGVAPSKVSKFGLSTSGSEMKVANVAAVLVTANLDSFVRQGSRIDILVSSIGDCKSLEGGTLVMTSLQAADGKIYAVAQGPVSIGGLSSSVTLPTHTTVAHLSGGAYVEADVPVTFIKDGRLTLNLKTPDFTTSQRISSRINLLYKGIARALDGGAVEVFVRGDNLKNTIGFISKLEQLKVDCDVIAKIIINERTGTIVTGDNVSISSVAVSHGLLTVNIGPEKDELGRDLREEPALGSKVMLVDESVSIGSIAKSLSVLGATPTDMIAIFQAMHKAGAIKAELIIM